jgi:hypothetical protein
MVRGMDGRASWNSSARCDVKEGADTTPGPMRIRHLVATAAILGALALPAPALADCQPAGELTQELAQAPIAFVGTVMEIGPAARAGNARFHVEDVWVGHLRETVTVYGLSSEQVSEDDRTWEVGARYLVEPIVDGNVLRDTICSATAEWRPELAALRPSGVPSSATGIGVPLLPILGVTAFVLVLLAAFVGYDRHVRGPRP